MEFGVESGGGFGYVLALGSVCLRAIVAHDPYISQSPFLYGTEVIQFMPRSADRALRRSSRLAGLAPPPPAEFPPPIVEAADPPPAVQAAAAAVAAEEWMDDMRARHEADHEADELAEVARELPIDAERIDKLPQRCPPRVLAVACDEPHSPVRSDETEAHDRTSFTDPFVGNPSKDGLAGQDDK